MSLDRFSIFFEQVNLNNPEVLTTSTDQFSITKNDLVKRGMSPTADFSKVYYVDVLVHKIGSFYPIKIIRFFDYQLSRQQRPLEWAEEVAKVLDIYKRGFHNWLGLRYLDPKVADTCVDHLTKVALDYRQHNANLQLQDKIAKLTPFVDRVDKFLKVEDAMVDEGWVNHDHHAQQKDGTKAALALIGHLMLKEGYFSKYTKEGSERIKIRHVRTFFETYFATTFTNEFSPSMLKKRARGTWKRYDFFSRFFNFENLP